METVYILQIITIVVSVFSVISTVVVNLITNKSNNVSNIVANQRLSFLQEYRKKSSLLLALCSPSILAEKKNDYLERQIILTSYELKNIFKGCYEEERVILNKIDAVVNIAMRFRKNPENTELQAILEQANAELFQVINVYDLAYWRFIIDQSSGKKYKVDDFDKYYVDAERRYGLKKNNKDKVQ